MVWRYQDLILRWQHSPSSRWRGCLVWCRDQPRCPGSCRERPQGWGRPCCGRWGGSLQPCSWRWLWRCSWSRATWTPWRWWRWPGQSLHRKLESERKLNVIFVFYYETCFVNNMIHICSTVLVQWNHINHISNAVCRGMSDRNGRNPVAALISLQSGQLLMLQTWPDVKTWDIKN